MKKCNKKTYTRNEFPRNTPTQKLDIDFFEKQHS